MSLNLLAKTVFSSGPDDVLAALDVYDKLDSKVVNSIQQLPDEDKFGKEIEYAGVPLEKDLPALVLPDGNFGKPIELDPKILTERMSGTDNILQGLFRELSVAVKNGSLMRGIKGGSKNGITGLLGGIVRKIIPGKLKDAKVISSMISQFSGGNYSMTFTDKGGTSALISTLTSVGSSMGLPKVFSTLAGGVTDKSILLNAAQQLLPSVIKSGDTGVLKDMLTTSVGKDIPGLSPNLFKSVLTNFSIPESTKQKNLSLEYDSISSSFNAIDINWNKVLKGSIPIISGLVSPKNSDFIKILSAKVFSQHKPIPAVVNGIAPTMPVHNETEKFQMLMKRFEVTTVDKELKKALPTVGRISITEDKKSIFYGTIFTPEFEKPYKRQEKPLTNQELSDLTTIT